MNLITFFRNAVLLLSFSCPCLLPAQLPISSPEQEGVSSAAVLSFVNRLEKEVDAVHSFMVLRHGKKISEGWWAPYDAETPHLMHSLSKSFTSTAIGLAIGEGKLSLDDPVISFFPEETPDDPGWQLKAMRIRDLITMNTGHEKEPRLFSVKENWVKTFLHSEVDFKPGTHFQYNSAATYMLSAILQKVTGEKLVDYLDSRLWQPLGIKKPSWEESPDGINTGGWGLSVTTEDIAKLGQLYLQKGMWGEKRILSEEWVAQATSKQTSNGSNPKSDWDQGYGFQFWRCRHNCYRGDGAFGQYCIVMPKHDAVVAITSGVSDMGRVMSIVWEVLLPAMQSAPVQVEDDSRKALAQKLGNLGLPPVLGEPSSQIAEKLQGQTFQMGENQIGAKTVSFDLHKKDDHQITIQMEGGAETLLIGSGKYLTEVMEYPLPYTKKLSRKIGTSGAWIKPDQYQARVYFCESPASIVYTFHFDEGVVTWKSELRHALFGPRNLAELSGKVE